MRFNLNLIYYKQNLKIIQHLSDDLLSKQPCLKVNYSREIKF